MTMTAFNKMNFEGRVQEVPASYGRMKDANEQLYHNPDLELETFLEDLYTDGWFVESDKPLEPVKQEWPTEVKAERGLFAGKKRWHSEMSAMTDATEDTSEQVMINHSPKSCTSTVSDGSSRTVASSSETLEIDFTSKRAGSRLTAMEIFHNFTKWYEDSNGKLYVDASGIISRECYLEWLDSRKQLPNRPEETFRKAILCHCTSSDGGSAPFQPEVEYALLQLLRRPGKVWPCFDGQVDKYGKPVRIGQKGLRAVGYHEKKKAAARGEGPAPKRARA